MRHVRALPTLVLLLALGALTAVHAQAQQRVVVKPVDTGEPLVNPSMGWAFHHYDNNLVRYGLDLVPSGTVDDFPGANQTPRFVYIPPGTQGQFTGYVRFYAHAREGIVEDIAPWGFLPGKAASGSKVLGGQ